MLSQPAVKIALSILALVILLGNTMIMVAFLRGRKGKEETTRRRSQGDIDELHQRVEHLREKSKN